jgi:hypothetical protein
MLDLLDEIEVRMAVLAEPTEAGNVEGNQTDDQSAPDQPQNDQPTQEDSYQ